MHNSQQKKSYVKMILTQVSIETMRTFATSIIDSSSIRSVGQETEELDFGESPFDLNWEVTFE